MSKETIQRILEKYNVYSLDLELLELELLRHLEKIVKQADK